MTSPGSGGNCRAAIRTCLLCLLGLPLASPR